MKPTMVLLCRRQTGLLCWRSPAWEGSLKGPGWQCPFSLPLCPGGCGLQHQDLPPFCAAMHKCPADIQCTDGQVMVLKYVSSYVSKWYDGAVYSGSALQRGLWLPWGTHLPLKNVSLNWSQRWCCSWRTSRWLKCLLAPRTLWHQHWTSPRPTLLSKSTWPGSPKNNMSASLNGFTCTTMVSPSPPRTAATRLILVGLKILSLFSPVPSIFYQFLVMQHHHSMDENLHHPQEDTLLPAVRYFAMAAELAPQL